MKIIEGIRSCLRGHSERLKRMEKMEVVRQDLDRKTEDMLKATLNGDEDWFREILNRNPECAGEILLRCAK